MKKATIKAEYINGQFVYSITSGYNVTYCWGCDTRLLAWEYFIAKEVN